MRAREEARDERDKQARPPKGNKTLLFKERHPNQGTIKPPRTRHICGKEVQKENDGQTMSDSTNVLGLRLNP